MSTNSSVLEAQNDKADDGLCSTDCDKLIPFIIVMFVLVLLFLLIEIPYFKVTINNHDTNNYCSFFLQSCC